MAAGKPQLISQIAEIFFNTLAVIATDVECADDPAGIGIYIHRQRNTNAQQWTGKFCQNRLQIIRRFVIFFLRRKVGKGARFKPQDASGQVSYTNFDEPPSTSLRALCGLRTTRKMCWLADAL